MREYTPNPRELNIRFVWKGTLAPEDMFVGIHEALQKAGIPEATSLIAMEGAGGGKGLIIWVRPVESTSVEHDDSHPQEMPEQAARRLLDAVSESESSSPQLGDSEIVEPDTRLFPADSYGGLE